MLKSKAKWKWNEQDDNTSIVDGLLHERGFITDEEKNKFLHPKLEDIQSPADLSAIEKAKQRIFIAMEQQEKVMVCGDYDAGATRS